MKKIISLIITLALTLGILASCTNGNGSQGGENTDTPTKIRIGYMAGPTGMGMAKLVADNGGLENGNDKYSFTKYADTAAAKADLAAGKIDVICLPTNEAAVYYNTVSKDIRVLAINCLNSLYLLSDKDNSATSFADLEGKIVYTCKNGTPRQVLEYIVKAENLDIEVSYTYNDKEILTPADLGALVTAGSLPFAVLPEPIVTSSLLAIQKNGNADIQYSVDVNLTNEWAKISDTPVTMGCIVTFNDFATENKDEIDAFLTEYKASVEYVGNSENLDSAANYVVETGVMAAAPAAKKALSNLGGAIAYIDGGEMKSALINFYGAIGLATLPGDEFYYEK